MPSVRKSSFVLLRSRPCEGVEELEREDRGGDHDDDDPRRERVFIVVGDGHFLCVSEQEHT